MVDGPKGRRSKTSTAKKSMAKWSMVIKVDGQNVDGQMVDGQKGRRSKTGSPDFMRISHGSANKGLPKSISDGSPSALCTNRYTTCRWECLHPQVIPLLVQKSSRCALIRIPCGNTLLSLEQRKLHVQKYANV
jgi:hypothetical protein